MEVIAQTCSSPPFAIAENPCVVHSHEAVNAEYRLMVIDAPDIALRAVAGQFFHLACPHFGEDQPLLRRPMSIYRIDREREQLAFLYKVQGVGTRALASLRPGDALDVLGPLGRGFAPLPGTKHVLIVARGVGLATMAPLAGLAVDQGARVTAILSARSPHLVMSEEYLRDVGAETIAVTDKEGTSDVAALEARLRAMHQTDPFDYVATCGSNRILDMLQRLGREWQIAGEVALEQQMGCGIGMCFCCVRPFQRADGGETYKRVCWDGPVFNLQEALPWQI
jgi:dihydroorotate dehydrogenase electron transfer subunit